MNDDHGEAGNRGKLTKRTTMPEKYLKHEVDYEIMRIKNKYVAINKEGDHQQQQQGGEGRAMPCWHIN